MTHEERLKLAYIAGVVEDAAAALRGDVILDDDDKEWTAEYLDQAAAFILKQIKTKAEGQS